MDTGAMQKPREDPGKDLSLIEEFIEAVQQENQQLWNEVHALGTKVRKFERILERIFQEEAAERLRLDSPKDAQIQCAKNGPSLLGKLRRRIDPNMLRGELH